MDDPDANADVPLPPGFGGLHDVLAHAEAFVALDPAGRCRYLNPGAAKLLASADSAGLLGRPPWAALPVALRLPLERACRQAEASQSPVAVELHEPTTQRWLEFRIHPAPGGLTVQGIDISARKQAEQALQQRERDFRLLAEQLPAIVYRASLDRWGRLLYVSPRIATLGYTPQQWVGDPDVVARTLHPDDLARVRRELAAALATGDEAQLEYRMHDSAGRWRHFSDSVQRVRGGDGSPLYLQGVAVDISERIAIEQALREREERLRLSEQRYRLAAASGHVWDWDASRPGMDISPGFWEQLGRPPPPSPQQLEPLLALLHEDDLPPLRSALCEHFARRVPYGMEIRMRHADGSWRWFQTQGQAVWDAEGRPTYMAGTTFDITARKCAEQALREAEGYRRSLFEQLGDGVVLFDGALRIVDANAQATAMFGLDHAELLRQGVPDLLAGFDRAGLHALEAAAPGAPTVLAEWEHLRDDGSRLPVEVSARPLGDGRHLAVLRDVGARRDAERKLLAYQIELSELTQRLLSQEKSTSQRIAQSLHDNLGQTLAVARLHVETARSIDFAASPGRAKEHCAQLDSLLAQALAEVRRVLAVLRPPVLDELGLAAALDNEIRLRGDVGRTEGRFDVLLEVDPAERERRWPPDVEYGAFMIAREAIANARQHAAASLVRVVLEGGDGWLRLAVVDDGRGISPPLRHGRPGHLGIVGMRERALAIGARLSLEPAPGGGTQALLCWPADGGAEGG